MRLVILGAPRTKKNHGSRKMFGCQLKTVPSDAWMAWRDSAVLQIAATRFQRVPDGRPLNCSALFYRDANRGDAVGYYQGLADVLEEAGVVSDDRLIAAWDGSRLRKDAKNPRVELILYPLEAP